MKESALNLWYELRDRRLWPVAALLLLGLVAAPLLLVKPVEEPAGGPAPPPRLQSQQQLRAALQLAESDTGAGSSLDQFDPKDPFRPPERVLRSLESLSSDPGGGGSTAGPPASSSGPSTSTSSGSSAGSASGALGGSGGSGGSGGTSVPPPSRPTTRRRTTLYTYVVDLTFASGDDARTITGMERLEMLPNKRNPLIVFLGVDAVGKRAVFLVDSKLKQSGEGRCADRSCSFISLSTNDDDDERIFTDEDGTRYRLRLDRIRRVAVDELKERRERRRAGAAGRRASPVDAVHPFVAPLFGDDAGVHITRQD